MLNSAELNPSDWDAYIVTEAKSFNFITCWSQQHYSFDIFITPFQVRLWAALLLSTAGMALFLNAYVRKWHTAIYHTGFSGTLLLVAYLFDDSIPISKAVGRKTAFRFALGIWLLVSVIIVQGYIGILITSISSPFPHTSVQGFDQLTKLICDYGPSNTTKNPCPAKFMYNHSLYRTYGNRTLDPGTDFRIMSRMKILHSTPWTASRIQELGFWKEVTAFARKLNSSLERFPLFDFIRNNKLEKLNALRKDYPEPVIIEKVMK